MWSWPVHCALLPRLLEIHARIRLNLLQVNLLPHLAAHARLYARIFAPFVVETATHDMAALPVSCVGLCDASCTAAVKLGVVFVAEFMDELAAVAALAGGQAEIAPLPLELYHAAAAAVVHGVALMEEGAQAEAERRLEQAAQRRGKGAALDPGKVAEDARLAPARWQQCAPATHVCVVLLWSPNHHHHSSPALFCAQQVVAL